MTVETQIHDHPEGSVLSPKYYEGLVDETGQQHRRYFSYHTEKGLVTGTTTNVMFPIARPARIVWPYFKDFNCWQNGYHHYYSGVAGDLEGHILRLTLGNEPKHPHSLVADYRVIRVIPEYLIVMTQIVLDSGPIAGMGGFMVFMLNERGGNTVVTIMMQHDHVTEGPATQAVDQWRSGAPENLMKWRDHFIPALTKLVEGHTGQPGMA